MTIENEILINQYGQSLIGIEKLFEIFNNLLLNSKKALMEEILFLIIQSKPVDKDVEIAIVESKLKPTFTPCILLRKGISSHNLKKLIELPENELNKVFMLLLALFKIAYSRRFELERGNPNKWWYWDLSNIEIVKSIYLKSNLG